jgi:hypothetical protein
MASLQAPPPVRHGKCRLVIQINGCDYVLRRVKLGPRGKASKSWSLTKADGTCYYVTRENASISCTCPDHRSRGSRCKHLRALVAAGLLCGRTCPSLRARAQGGSNV